MTSFIATPHVHVRPATPADRPTIERLWLMFRHDMSEFGTRERLQLPNTDGTFHCARRGGVGMRAVRDVVARYPGEWEVAFQDGNPGAVAFWRRVGEELAPGEWGEERRPVPERPDLAPDVWVSFRYGEA
ncbi:GNAT family N-acetyltransferase [Streptomyces prunicolor]|uniref:GNAT family N-acetyltransferase n=1 Tax=Streptomyces prunicolor TaxID=67348 RepID=UPI00224CE9A2|nr:GNAT family N-acetyltransferase [Streptomyces prunicolor]MCX5234565.1 GNAT family N-acetyltransferase [Streptomyces prunicolor]